MFSQPPIEWQKSYGGTDWDEAQAIEPTPDGGYIVVGFASSINGDVTGNHGSGDYWVVKLNSTGVIQWQKALGGPGMDHAYTIKNTADGGYIVAGMITFSGGDITGFYGDNDAWIVKLASTGNIQWQKNFGGIGDDVIHYIRQTSDGGYVAAGYTTSNNLDVSGNHGGYDGWVIKLDNTGTLQWQKCLGGSASEGISSLEPTTDGGYILAGQTNSSNGDVSGGHGGNDYWVIKLNSSGAIQWQKCLGGVFEDYAYSIKITTDGGYIVAGYAHSNNGDVTGNHGSHDFWIVKLDNSGVIQWQKCFGGSSDDIPYDISLTSDGGFIVAGFSQSNDGDVTSHQGSFNFPDYWLIRLDNNGNLQWQKSIGSTAGDIANSIFQTTDGGYIVAGYSGANDGDVTDNHGGHDYWVVKLGTAPCIPQVYIISSATTVCNSGSVTFYANPLNGGSAPSYQWKKNGNNTGANSATYTDNAWADGDVITCVLTSNASCAVPTTATSNAITITVISGPPVITTIAGTGFLGFSGDGAAATSAKLFSPGGICFDPAGNLIFADRGNHRIRKIAAGTGTISTIAGTGNTAYTGDGGPAINADLAGPRGVFVD